MDERLEESEVSAVGGSADRSKTSRTRACAIPLVVLFSFQCLLRAGPLPPEAGQGTSPADATEKKRPPVQLGWEIRSRVEVRDNADQLPLEDLDRFLGQRIRMRLQVPVDSNFSFHIQAQEVELWGTQRDKVIHDLATNLHQAFFNWRVGGSPHWELRGGRQELIYGEERLIGAFGWDNVGRSFDGARLQYKNGAWSSDFLAAQVVDVRRAGAPARPSGQQFYGAYITRAVPKAASQTEFYGLFLRDGLQTAGEIARARPQDTEIATFGFRRVYRPPSGWRYLIEHAWQFGRRGPDAHRAAMLISNAGYAWAARFQPRLAVEYNFATGDNNLRDGRSREFHNLFPTNHPLYGQADLFGLRNLHAFRINAAWQLHPKLSMEMDYYRFLLAAERGPWKNAAGRVLGFDPAGTAGRDVGQEFDVTVRVPIDRRLSLMTGYFSFFPGKFATRTRGPERHSLGYVQTTVTF